MEELLEKVIKKTYELQFINKKVHIYTSDCFVPGEEDDYYKLADYIRDKKIPINNVIEFKPYHARFGKYEISLNILKKNTFILILQNCITNISTTK